MKTDFHKTLSPGITHNPKLNESQRNDFCLFYCDLECTYSIAFFEKMEEAEAWKNFLAYTLKQFDFDNLHIARRPFHA